MAPARKPRGRPPKIRSARPPVVDPQQASVFLDGLEALGIERRVEAYEQAFGSSWPEGTLYRDKLDAVAAVLRVPWVATEHGRRMRGGLSASDVTAKRVVQELAAIAFVDPRNLVHRVVDIDPKNPDGGRTDRLVCKDLDQLDEATARAISSVKPVHTLDGRLVGYEVRFWPKLDALKQLAELTEALTKRAPSCMLTPADLSDEELEVALLELEGPKPPPATTLDGIAGDDDV